MGTVLKGLGLALVLALVAGCGGGGGGGSSDKRTGGGGGGGGGEVAAFEGTVMAPGGALVYRPASTLERLAGLLVSTAHADMAGLNPVAGIQIELIRVDNNGNPVGAPLATATTSATGHYVLTLPAGMRVAPASNLVIRAVGLTQTLRAQAVSANVTVDPVSEFVLRKLIDFQVPLDAVSTAEVIRIRGDVDSLGMDAGLGLDDAFDALEKAAGSYVDSQAEVIAAGSADNPSPVLGIWRASGLRLEMGYRSGGLPPAGTFGAFTENYGMGLETSGGKLVVRPGLVEGVTRFVEQYQLVFGGADLYGPEVELDPVEPGAKPISGVLRLLGNLGFAIEHGFEEDVIPEDDFARRQAAGTETLHFAGDSLRVGLNRSYEQLYGVTDGRLDEEDFRGERLLSALTVAGREPDALTASDFSGRYGLVEFGVDVGINYLGAVSYLRELSFNGAGKVSAAANDEVELEHHYGDAPKRIELSEGFAGDYSVNGKQLVLSEEGDELIRFDVAGNGADAFFTSQMEDDATIKQSLLLAVKLPAATPNLDGRRYRIQGMGTRMHREGGEDHLAVELEGHGEFVFEGGNVSLQGWQSRLIERFRTIDGPGVKVSGPNDGPVVSVTHGPTPGAITIKADDATFKGFVSADGQVLVLRHDLHDAAGHSLGMWIGLRVD